MDRGQTRVAMVAVVAAAVPDQDPALELPGALVVTMPSGLPAVVVAPVALVVTPVPPLVAPVAAASLAEFLVSWLAMLAAVAAAAT